MTRKERILARLAELGAQPKRSLGQNFLVSDHVVEKILGAVRREEFSCLIEVGPGLGALTEDLVLLAKELGRQLVLLELDRKFAETWRARGDDLRVVEGDALQIDWRELKLPEKTLFVSNLPYQISSSLVIERSVEPAGIDRMILMFQKEVAQRIAATPSSKDYGLLSVIAQTFWSTSTVSEAGPRDFFPPPNVASRVLQFRRKSAFETSLEREQFLKFCKAAFAHRRKLLARNLQASVWGEGADEGLAKLGLLPTARAEELDPVAFVGLYQALGGAKERGKG